VSVEPETILTELVGWNGHLAPLVALRANYLIAGPILPTFGGELRVVAPPGSELGILLAVGFPADNIPPSTGVEIVDDEVGGIAIVA
jgi:hypothetical protein